jgi:hypothetical protein
MATQSMSFPWLTDARSGPHEPAIREAAHTAPRTLSATHLMCAIHSQANPSVEGVTKKWHMSGAFKLATRQQSYHILHRAASCLTDATHTEHQCTDAMHNLCFGYSLSNSKLPLALANLCSLLHSHARICSSRSSRAPPVLIRTESTHTCTSPPVFRHVRAASHELLLPPRAPPTIRASPPPNHHLPVSEPLRSHPTPVPPPTGSSATNPGLGYQQGAAASWFLVPKCPPDLPPSPHLRLYCNYFISHTTCPTP